MKPPRALVSTSVTRNITLALDKFGRSSLEGHAVELGVAPGGIIRQGALYYLAERGSERTARKIPRFARQAVGSEELKLPVMLDEADWHALEDEAQRQLVTLDRMLVHAALLLLADLDSGRVAVRILEDEDEES